ncbi:cell division protein FtsA [Sphingomonas sinipercae]|uniref:Cell division protein FtsA n=1 Tax=Sphingomonas sinipercae TaxID=2714944 RepID=A0A6G7ZQ90_9SPHN|nr:cell division protein FtsA [Sphingomonas sinipercae]QIL03070.1 cell division protein FtsA [Sphingomonas sinipercae]
MADTGDQPLIAALDIGSSKVSALIATRDSERNLRVLGTGQRESRGVKRGYITDVEASEFAVREAVELAERMSGVTIEDVWASYGAGGLISRVANVEVELGGHQIEQADIDELMRGGRQEIGKDEKVILHAHPALYSIDGADGVQQPIGLHANRLGVDIHVISADPAPLRNVDYVIRTAHLGVKAIVASPIAAALACLTDEERELGVALVELGAGVTNVSLHAGGMLLGLRSIPLGARDITDDIAAAFGVRRRDAERLKCFYGSAMTSPRDNHEMIEAAHSGSEQGADPIRLTRAQLMMVIRHRVEELTGAVDAALKALGFSGPVGRPVVLTGGGAELKNIADYMQGVLGRTVRIGRPKTLAGLPDAHSGPAFSTLVGLACLAGSRSGDIRDIAMAGGGERKPTKGLVGRLISALKQSY